MKEIASKTCAWEALKVAGMWRVYWIELAQDRDRWLL